MKTKQRPTVAALLALAGLSLTWTANVTASDSLNLETGKVLPGGASRGGQFSLEGTLGQHDAGTVRAAQFTLQGGLWNGPVILQTQGAPILRIRAGIHGAVVLSWPIESTGWTLQECGNLADGLWQNSRANVVDNAMEHTVTLSASAALRCFRLKK